jgi:hypothetical protein
MSPLPGLSTPCATIFPTAGSPWATRRRRYAALDRAEAIRLALMPWAPGWLPVVGRFPAACEVPPFQQSSKCGEKFGLGATVLTPSPACGPKPTSVSACGCPFGGRRPVAPRLVRTPVARHPLPQGGEGWECTTAIRLRMRPTISQAKKLQTGASRSREGAGKMPTEQRAGRPRYVGGIAPSTYVSHAAPGYPCIIRPGGGV